MSDPIRVSGERGETSSRRASREGIVRSVCFIVPTYNEAENIASLLETLLAACDDARERESHVLVVDDDSPDGTGELVARVAQLDPRVHLLRGAKNGLGTAYTRGFDWALAHLDIDAVVQMDADFSHDPADAARLLAALEDADVAIGSRYVDGGETDALWGRARRMISRCGNLFARYVAGVRSVRDATAGFKAIRVDALRRAFPFRFGVQGYVFQVALLHALLISGARVKELPIHFADRRAGATKLGGRDVAEFFLHVWWLRLLSKKTFVKFCLTGLSGVFVNLSVFAAFSGGGVDPYLSSAIAIEVSIVWNFFLNNYWTFRDREIAQRVRVRGLKFNAVSLVTLGVSFTSFVLLRALWPEQPALLAQAASIVPGALANYFANSYWTFKARPDASLAGYERDQDEVRHRGAVGGFAQRELADS